MRTTGCILTVVLAFMRLDNDQRLMAFVASPFTTSSKSCGEQGGVVPAGCSPPADRAGADNLSRSHVQSPKVSDTNRPDLTRPPVVMFIANRALTPRRRHMGCRASGSRRATCTPTRRSDARCSAAPPAP